MSWSEWKSFADVVWNTVPKNPGVYYIRCTDRTGKPMTLRRLGGTDHEGIIYIGETGRSLQDRLKGFWETAQDRKIERHGAGWNFSYYKYTKIFPLARLQFSYLSCRDKKRTRTLEAGCFWEYRKTKGLIDLPPLNFSSGLQDF